MIISISGKPGSGKSSVAKIISKKLDMKRYYIGQIQRDIAKKKGITINELSKIEEKDDSTDRMVEGMIEKLGKTEDNFVIESRTAFHFIPQSIKIFLDVSDEEGAKRVFNESKEALKKRNEPLYNNIEQVKKANKERMESEKKRYKEYYGIDPYDHKKYDLVIDTTDLSIKETVNRISDYLNKTYLNKP